ncbi:fungal-specific transcription factor domain-containing protein [Exophiala viscosa]|uniref:Fungal-specific transcription factor domain-containing protein n=1 Tax=Exophiala viscosa TaxID=2486360 RepID=A0AAN6DZH2_9EURO|nr:fungal-specific transcription factor domain-containing protein [Exophiala viscosa]KAI1624120.1 fungal-specific transcription factor domain-containing protein [Exophiala viscosa]
MKEAGTTRPRFTAFAPTDCHTCLSGNRKCERQRPYCSTCLERGVKCGGYATTLSWHSSRAYSGRTSSRGHQQRPNRRSPFQDQQCGRGGPTNLITETAGTFRLAETRSRGSKKTSPVTPSQTEDNLDQHSESPEGTIAVIEDEGRLVDTTNIDSFLDDFAPETYPENAQGHDVVPGLGVTSPSIQHLVPWTGGEAQNNEVIDYEDVLPTAIPSTTVAVGHLDSATLSPSNLLSGSDIVLSFDWSNMEPEDTQEMLDSAFSTFPLAPYPGAAWRQQHEMALKYYDTDLCILPLTSDMVINPFRIRGFASEDSQLLVQSVLALYSQHQVNTGNTQPTEAMKKRSQVAEMLSQALQNGQSSHKTSCLLEAILIMFTLDCTISALGNWADHIRNAATVFEAWGGASALNSPRLRSQASMLVWWDATLAMISRQGVRLHPSYFEHLLNHELNDGWSFYELTGCPTELVVFLVRLAEMARQKELADSMQFLTFDMTVVLDIEQQLLHWKNSLEVEVGAGYVHGGMINLLDDDVEDDSPTTSEEGENEGEYSKKRDDYHCMEAWRYALLLYIQRVFRWNRQSHRRPRAILPLTCKIIEHCRNCRKTSQVQKQLLLPIFLAGAEARDRDVQDTVRAYCLWWGARSRYGMFYSVSSLLEEYWENKPSKDGSPVWWGSFLDSKSPSGRAGDVTAQFLFG